MDDKRLIIISYRLPFSFKTENRVTSVKASAGGLVTAVKSLDVESSVHKPVWIGCADFTQRVWEKNHHLVNDDFEYVPVFLDKTINKGFYNGFANSVLWPLFHYFTTFVDYHDEHLKAYQSANQAVCDKVVELLQPNDIVWVHDYHFIALPQLIRQKRPSATIGYFLHIPFPSYELLRLLPGRCRNYLLNGLLGADLVGFHTHDYRIHFLQSVQLGLGLSHSMGTISAGERRVRTDTFPIGINYNLFHDAYDDDEVVQERQELQKVYPYKIIFSVDRLDYTKGVMQRLDALEAMLRQHPEWTEKLVFILVVIPSRDQIQTYGERRQMIEQAVGRINGLFGTLTWLPIVYRYTEVSPSQLGALYTACDVALITPLRDGMNLVAKEFIASRKDQQGVLVLSELTGAATELGEALLVNPLDEYDVAEQLRAALSMSTEEQRARMTIMQQRVADYDVKKWANDFVETLLRASGNQSTPEMALSREAAKRAEPEPDATASSRLVLLDYTGTLVDGTADPKRAGLPENIVRCLRELAAISQQKVLVISGRSPESLAKGSNELPIALVSGQSAHDKEERGWKATIRPLMEDFVSRCNGSFLDEKEDALTWHYQGAAEAIGFERSRELIHVLSILLPTYLRLVDDHKLVEVKEATETGKVVQLVDGEYSAKFSIDFGDE